MGPLATTTPGSDSSHRGDTSRTPLNASIILA
jgi:hypothetical protein